MNSSKSTTVRTLIVDELDEFSANLVSGDTVNEAALAQFERLFAQLGLPPAELTALVQALRATDPDAALIGHLTQGPPTIHLV